MERLFSKVYCLDSGLNTGAENMEVDQRLMTSFIDGRFQQEYGSDSCLWRFYAWQPWAVTLGYNQDISGIDALKCRSAGIDVVRRPTGGRAVFHAEEFTYSFFCDTSADNALLYRMVHEVIRLALELLGIHAEFCRSTLSRSSAGSALDTVSCFTSSARYELQVDGRKLVGSAQRRSRNVLLQHGSLPLSSRHKELCDFVAFAKEDAFDEIRNQMERKTTSLEEILGYIPEYSVLAKLMRSAMLRLYNVEVVDLQVQEISGLFNGCKHPVY